MMIYVILLRFKFLGTQLVLKYFGLFVLQKLRPFFVLYASRLNSQFEKYNIVTYWDWSFNTSCKDFTLQKFQIFSIIINFGVAQGTIIIVQILDSDRFISFILQSEIYFFLTFSHISRPHGTIFQPTCSTHRL